jgi:hypothetical protein
MGNYSNLALIVPETAETIKELRALISDLSVKNQDFAKSLCEQHDKRGKLSPAQWVWVGKLLEWALVEDEEPEAKKLDATGLFKLFEDAKAHGTKWPKLTFSRNGLKIQLSMSGLNAKIPGAVNVTDGKKFGENKWYGRITSDGAYTASHQATEDVQSFLINLVNDPASAIERYGKQSGHCCFCNTKIESENSLKAGYGPVCAEKWGLYDNWKKATN